MKKALIITLAVTAIAFSGCGGGGFRDDGEITVVTREDGSGTRGAFIELFGVQQEINGEKKDMTTKEAVVANKTDVLMTNIANDPLSIGYISLGSLNDTIQAVNIDGVVPSAENIKNGSYKFSRPFNIATKGAPEGLTKDFIDFILSKEGQEVVSNGYIQINESATPYTGSKPSGKITVAGSSSVSPVMEKLREAYIAVNPGADIEIQMSDSTTGMTCAMDGTANIGMASRELKDSEKAVLSDLPIALDGIVVIVNKENPTVDLASDQVMAIFTGLITSWNELN